MHADLIQIYINYWFLIQNCFRVYGEVISSTSQCHCHSSICPSSSHKLVCIYMGDHLRGMLLSVLLCGLVYNFSSKIDTIVSDDTVISAYILLNI